MRFFIVLFVVVMLLVPGETLAKREKPLHFPFPEDMVGAIRCDVCGALVRKVYKDIQALFAARAQATSPLNEEEVLTALEDVCNPFAGPGQWIRRLAINGTGDAASRAFKLEELPVHTQCGRTCGTIVEACQAVMDHESMDQFSSRLLRLHEYADGEALARVLCHSSPMCTEREDLGPVKYQQLLAMIKVDRIEEIEPKEMEVERMMDEVERKENRRQHVFSRKEVMLMQDAILRGDREKAAEVDPSIMKLNDEEFASLQSMMRDKKVNSPEATSSREEKTENGNEEQHHLEEGDRKTEQGDL